MKLKSSLTAALVLLTLTSLTAKENYRRPCELQFYVNSQLVTRTVISYNQNGDVIKMSSFDENRLTDYAKYKYNSEGKVSLETSYDSTGIVIRTKVYDYDKKFSLITGEKVYSQNGDLIEYQIINYNNTKIDKIYYYKADGYQFQSIDFKYKNDILFAMIFKKTGKYILIMKTIYDDNMLPVGHDIIHSSADVKLETKYIYENGYAAEASLQLIFR